MAAWNAPRICWWGTEDPQKQDYEDCFGLLGRSHKGCCTGGNPCTSRHTVLDRPPYLQGNNTRFFTCDVWAQLPPRFTVCSLQDTFTIKSNNSVGIILAPHPIFFSNGLPAFCLFVFKKKIFTVLWVFNLWLHLQKQKHFRNSCKFPGTVCFLPNKQHGKHFLLLPWEAIPARKKGTLDWQGQPYLGRKPTAVT